MTVPTPINPLLQAHLPEMIERLTRAKRSVADILQPIAVDMSALGDFLDFEIDRTELELSKAEWSSKADTDAIRKRVAYLQSLKAGIDPSGASAALQHLENALGVLNRLRRETD